MSYTTAAFILAGIAAPHLLRLESAPPVVAAWIWLAALALRAVASVTAALYVVLYVPTTELFDLVTQWCWHAVMPFIASHLPVNGHTLGDAAVIVPGLVLGVSAVAVVVGLWRATRAVARLLQQAVVGPGPKASLVLAGGEVLVAAAGLRRPRVVISAGALLLFDDEELAASLEHEHGHIARRHRYLFLAAELCRAFARFLPGTQWAKREFVFHVERDADQYAVSRHHDPAALARAICKVALAPPPGPAAAALGGGVVARRVRLLLEMDATSPPRRFPFLHAVAAGMATLLVIGTTALPASAHAGYHAAAATQAPQHCDD